MRVLERRVCVVFEEILFATDFSPCSEAALPHALAIARRFNSTVHVVHVMPAGKGQWVPPEISSTTEQEQNRRFAEERITRLASESLEQVSHKVLLEQGNTWGVISKLIRERRIDLVIIGTHGRKGMQRLLLGSVAEQVLRLAPCPVLTVGPHVSGKAWEEKQRTEILYATDFSVHSCSAMPYVISLAQQLPAHLTLLHVGPPPKDMFSFERAPISSSSRARLRILVPPDVKLEPEPDLVVEFGDPAEIIVKVAALRSADLIVLGVRRGGAFARATTHLPEGVGYRVVCEAHCPVLTVRGNEDQ